MDEKKRRIRRPARERKDRVAALFSAGWSVHKIATTIGSKPETVRKDIAALVRETAEVESPNRLFTELLTNLRRSKVMLERTFSDAPSGSKVRVEAAKALRDTNLELIRILAPQRYSVTHQGNITLIDRLNALDGDPDSPKLQHLAEWQRAKLVNQTREEINEATLKQRLEYASKAGDQDLSDRERRYYEALARGDDATANRIWIDELPETADELLSSPDEKKKREAQDRIDRVADVWADG